MTDKQALRALIEAVEAAGIGGTDWGDFSAVPPVAGTALGHVLAHRAYHGSLDAAKVLHDVLLAGWSPSICQNVHHGYWFAHLLMAKNGSVVGDYGGYAIDNPARAWLIAILKAYEAHQ